MVNSIRQVAGIKEISKINRVEEKESAIKGNAIIDNTSYNKEIKIKTDIETNLDNSKGYDKDRLYEAVKEANKYLFKNEGHFEFEVHERTGRIMVRLIDNESKEVIKEIPPEKILDLVASIWDLVGILVDERG
ncbi:MAG: flagellar protein FlaG [Tissierellales bacterium]|nr:flagellar protein FlaG [Tissierellales bacterium]